jgi:hypothetical protein
MDDDQAGGKETNAQTCSGHQPIPPPDGTNLHKMQQRKKTKKSATGLHVTQSSQYAIDFILLPY